PLFNMMSIYASVGRIAPMQIKSTNIKVRGNAYGIKSGWFNHPFNFDPVWLEECTGFKKKRRRKP
ncbi:hypothetical protein LCGC14_1644330, partial [marine sediment metagenome]